MDKKYKNLKYGCYMMSMSMSVVANLSPVLFITFRELYGISYSALGFLILVNFVTQLSVDLIFSFFSHKFNIEKTVKSMPIITLIGLLTYSLLPLLFPSAAYVGILIGTVIFSAASGLAEVLTSPVIAAIPAENPEREVGKLHSVYAWGVVAIIIFATAYLLVFDNKTWWVLSLIFTAIPLTGAALFAKSEIPKMETPKRVSGALHLLGNRGLWLSVFGIFLGGAAECTMAQWCSGYIERALGIPKFWGDVFGVAGFALMLGIGRTLYSKYGKCTERFLLFGAIGATVCYFVAATVNVELIGLIACAMTGFFAATLWPGGLIVASERFPTGGVFVYAIMAAGGDLGASVTPQLVGIVTDSVIASSFAVDLALRYGITVEQLGMKFGMLTGMLFPLIAIFVYLVLYKTRKDKKLKNAN